MEKNFFIPMAGAGISGGSRHAQTSFTYVLWGEKFAAQQEYLIFGALALSYLF